MTPREHEILEELEREWNRKGDVDVVRFLNAAATSGGSVPAIPLSSETVLEAVLIDIERRARFPKSLRQVTLDEYLDLLPVLRRDLKVTDQIRRFLATIQDTFQLQSAESLSAARKVRRNSDFSGNLSPGQRICQYEILEKIASGGMGIVFKARDTRSQRLVALKVIRDWNAASADERARFEAEASAAAQLDHAGIVPVFESRMDGDLPFLAMALVDGENLATYVPKTHPTSRQAAELCLQIAEAMHYAHCRGVVHRDLKPTNILIDNAGQIRITDFGLAKRLDDGRQLTTTGQILGTPAYMSPEQASGDNHNTGPLSDIYAIGAVLYYCLTEVAPFRAATAVATMKKVLESPVIPPRRINPDIDRDVETLCLKCLEKSPSDRIPAAEKLAIELTNYLNGRSIAYRRTNVLNRTIRWCRRNVAVTSLGAAVLVAIFAVWAAAGWFLESSQQEAAFALLDQLRTDWSSETLTAQTRADIARQMMELRQRAPKQYAGAMRELSEQMQNRIRTGLHVGRISDRELDDLDTQIRFLSQWDAAAAVALTETVNSRRQDWRVVEDWSCTAGTSGGCFKDGAITVRDGACYSSDLRRLFYDDPLAEWTSPLLPTNVICDDNLSVAMEFGSGWKLENNLGVVIQGGTIPDYDFLIRTSSVGTEKKMLAFHDAAQYQEACVVDIRRRGRLLHRNFLSAADLPDDHLQLSIRREAGILSFQVEKLTPLTFVDSLPINTNASRLSLRCSGGVPVMSLTVLKKPTTAFSELEKADISFQNQQFAEAIELYQETSAGSGSITVRMEAAFKSSQCLVALNRRSDALESLRKISTGDSSAWSVLAGFHLWEMLLENGSRDEADSLAIYLAGRYVHGDLAGHIPYHVWRTISESYLHQSQNLAGVLKPQPRIVETLEALVELGHRISANGLAEADLLLELAVAYRQFDRYEEALAVLQQVSPSGLDHGNWVNRNILENRCLRVMNRNEEALQRLDMALQKPPFGLTDTSSMLVSRACSLIALSREDEARQTAEQAYSVSESHLGLHAMCDAAILLGFLAQHAQDEPAARAWWTQGWKAGRELLNNGEPLGSRALVNGFIMGSLLDDFTDQDVRKIIQHPQVARNALLRVAGSAVPVEPLAESFRSAWQSSDGRELAESIAFDRLSIQDRIRRPAIHCGAYALGHGVNGGEPDPDSIRLLKQLCESNLDNYLKGEAIGVGHVLQFGLAWSGSTNAIGLTGLLESLNAAQRPLFLTVLAQRFAMLNKLSDARQCSEMALQTGDPSITEYVRSNLEMIDRNESLVTVQNQTGFAVKLRLRPEDTVAGQEEIIAPATTVEPFRFLRLPAGAYEVLVESDSGPVQVSHATLSLFPSARRLLKIVSQ